MQNGLRKLWKVGSYRIMGSSEMDKAGKEKESKTPPATTQVLLVYSFILELFFDDFVQAIVL